MGRRAVKEGKRPVVSPPLSLEEEEEEVPLIRRRCRPAGGITIHDHPTVAVQPPSRVSPSRVPPPRVAPPRVAPPPPVRPTPPTIATSDLAGLEGTASTMTPEEVDDLRVRYRETAMAGKFLIADAACDDWKNRFREAEGKAAAEFNRTLAAEAKLAEAMARLGLAEGKVE